MKLPKFDLMRLLSVLTLSPFMFSYIDADIADSLEDDGLFSLETGLVTEAGAEMLRNDGAAAS